MLSETELILTMLTVTDLNVSLCCQYVLSFLVEAD